MSIALRLERVLPDVLGALFDFSALTGDRAVAVLAQGASDVLARFSGGEEPAYLPIDSALIPGAKREPRYFERAVLCRVGNGFALVAPEGVARWRSFEDEPRSFRRVDRFPRNQHGFAVQIAAGGASDDPNAALVILREPQIVHDVTRYAWLRFDEADGGCRWDGLRADGDPCWLDRDDFPIPPLVHSMDPTFVLRPILFHADWRAGSLRVFVVGLNGNYERWGMDYSIAAEVRGGRARVVWASEPGCFGTFSTSGRYLIVNPLRMNGPTRGASRLFDLDTGELHTVAMPRGFAKFQVADHAGDRFWIRTRRGEPLRFAICGAV
jgi:hypothetical protein